ncbi:MAG: hypothetical protein HGB26_06955 [Desulfobulbaceae bacterium]|nr:hypothetical protein [Desulfobulbaceae bacterium]
MSYTIGFGKHKDKTLEWLFFNDPGYVWWMIDEGAQSQIKGGAGARTRFALLVKRAKHLAIPGTCKQCSRLVSKMSLTMHPNGGLAEVDFFCDKCHRHGEALSVRATPAFYNSDVFRNYDKLGAKFLVDAIKLAYFGKKVRMTQAKMEEFFDNPSNFVDP